MKMLEYQIKGAEELAKRFAAGDQAAKKHLTRAMNQSVETVANEARPLTPVGVSGQLRRSIGGEVRETGSSIVGVVGSSLKNEIYPSVMEFGRRPGTMPPPSALERWVHIVMKVPVKNAKGVAFTVARAIARNGIKARRFLQTGFEKAKGRVEEYHKKAVDQFAKEIANGS